MAERPNDLQKRLDRQDLMQILAGRQPGQTRGAFDQEAARAAAILGEVPPRSTTFAELGALIPEERDATRGEKRRAREVAKRIAAETKAQEEEERRLNMLEKLARELGLLSEEGQVREQAERFPRRAVVEDNRFRR